MTYHLYNTQLAMSWVQRVKKEEQQAQIAAEKLLKNQIDAASGNKAGSVAGSYVSTGSKAPSGFTSKTSVSSRLAGDPRRRDATQCRE